MSIGWQHGEGLVTFKYHGLPGSRLKYMRRIVENYFGMLGTRKYDHVIAQFETAEEKMICESLFYWINDESHSIPDDLYIDSYSDSIEKYKAVFHRVFMAMRRITT